MLSLICDASQLGGINMSAPIYVHSAAGDVCADALHAESAL